MEFYQLLCFVEVAKYENMTTASQKMYVSQSSLSKTIARLEKNVGMQLFDRVGTTIKLNAYGRELLKSAEQIIVKVKRTELLLEQMHNGEYGSVTIGSTLFSYLDDLVENFIMLHPNISIKTVSGSADLLQRELLNGGIDLIISTYPYSDTDFKEIPIFKEPMGVCMAKDHPLADKESLSIQDLHYEKFIINNPSSDKSNQTMRVCEAAGFIPNVIFEGMMPRTCGALVSKHRGIMVLCKSRFSYMKMKFKEEYSQLVHKELCDAGVDRVTKITMTKNATITKAVEMFIDYTVAYGYDAFCGTLPRVFDMCQPG